MKTPEQLAQECLDAMVEREYAARKNIIADAIRGAVTPLVRILQDIQWEGSTLPGTDVCPRCQAMRPPGHEGGCALAAALKAFPL